MIPNVDILSDAGHITFIFFTLTEYYKVFRFHFYTLLFCRAQLCFAKLGGTSAEQSKKIYFFALLCVRFALTLHNNYIITLK